MLNRIILMGRLTRDPELRHTQTGTAVASFSLAVDRDFRNRDSGHAIENVVYFELLCRGYDVAIGKVGTAEVDFIATKADEKLYVQVTESMESETVRARELAPLQKIADNYEKIVLSLNPGLDSSYEGIKSLNLIDWLLESK